MEAYIAGTLSSSIINWPGKTSFVVLFAGCDFRCGYCNSQDCLETKPEYKVQLKDLKKEIIQTKNFVDAVVFSGGEPCLQKTALMYLAFQGKMSGLLTGLETNGSNPKVIETLIDKELIDFVAADIKAPLNPNLFENVTKSRTFFKSTEQIIENIKNSLEILKNSKIQKEIRTTVVPGLIYRKEDMLAIAKEIPAGFLWRIQGFKPGKTKFQKVNSPTSGFLMELKKTCQKEFPRIKIVVE